MVANYDDLLQVEAELKALIAELNVKVEELLDRVTALDLAAPSPDINPDDLGDA